MSDYGYGPINSRTAFLSEDFYLPEDDPELVLEIIAKREALTANMLNVREIAFYDPSEIVTGQSWFSSKQPTIGQSTIRRIAYRRVFNLVELNGGAIPVGTTQVSVKPSIKNIVMATRGFGSAMIAGPKFVFFPSSSISVTFDSSAPSSQLIIIANGLAVPLLECYFTLEYLQQT